MREKEKLEISLPPPVSNSPAPKREIPLQVQECRNPASQETSPQEPEKIMDTPSTKTENNQPKPSNDNSSRKSFDENIWVIGMFVMSLLALVLSCYAIYSAKQVKDSVLNNSENATIPDILEKLSYLNKQVSNLRNEVNKGNLLKFDPANSKGYLRAKTSSVDLLVSLTKVEPYLDGQKVYLEVGNPSLSNLQGLTLTAYWGPRQQEGEDFGDWIKKLRTSTIRLNENISPGKWNKVSFVVSPAPATNFGHLSIEVATDTISLAR